MQAQGSALLLQGAHESNFHRVPAAILHLPRRRPHSQREEAQRIANIMFPDSSSEKAIIQYEEQRKHAVAAYRRDKAAALERHKQYLEAKRPDRRHAPWDPVRDPVELPKAAPMPVTVGEKEDFKDCFAFLRSTDGSRVEALMNMPDPSSSLPASLGVTVGAEPGHGTRLLEFRRGVVYEDGRLDLCKMVVGPDHIDELMDALEGNGHVRHFLLGNNVITNHGARRIARFVRDHPGRMATWYLAGNHIKPAGFRELSQALAGSEVLENLWLKRNPLGPESVGGLLAVLGTAKQLQVLDVETCELGDAGVAELFEGLADVSNALEAVYINGNGVSTSGSAAIARFLTSKNCKLKYLMMSNNPLGDAGVQALATGLDGNASLEVLTIASCGLSSTGVSAVCRAAAQHPRIRYLDLASRFSTADLGQRFNHIGDGAVRDIRAAAASPSLRFLHLGYTALSRGGLEEIRDVVAGGGSSLVAFEASLAVPSGGNEEEEGARAGGGACSLRVRRALEANYLRFYGGEGQMAEGVPYADFVGVNGRSRLLRNSPSVRLIDSVYRTRDKGNTANGKTRKYWDIELNETDRAVWERLEDIV